MQRHREHRRGARQLDGKLEHGHMGPMGGVFFRILSAILLLVCLAAAWGGVRALVAPKPPVRGELVDIGGRRLRIVCEGPRSDKPLVVMESGIFGFASDWGEVQKALAARGVRTCAYDRAGLGFSDPGPFPRDGVAVVEDLEKLLAAKGETGPLVLVGHSMAGLHTRLFALRNPGRVKGLLLVDAASPDGSFTPRGLATLAAFRQMARFVEAVGRLGLMKAVAPWTADMIGLDGPAHVEKVFFWAYNPTLKAGAEETYQALRAAEQAKAAGRLDPELPVGVITEGRVGPDDPRLEGAKRSRYGWSANLPDATHASMLGRRYAGAIADGVERVLAAAR
jgi:pimeloyl-ACP methyl ester carboxylesterase